MKKQLLTLVLFFSVCVTASQAQVELLESHINIDGSATHLNNDPTPAEVDDSGFDYNTGLGTITATVSGAGAHNVDLFVNHDMSDLINTFFNELGDDSGLPAPGQSWEIDEPQIFPLGDIFDNFLNSDLDNLNGFFGIPEDVSMALGWDFTLLPFQKAIVTFDVTDLGPPSGFHLTHWDPDSEEQIWFSSSLEVCDVPEPSTCIMWGLMGLVGTSLYWKRRKG